MNKTAIEWCDMTWNPATGCKHGCPYCYARKIAERFKGSKAWPQGFEPMYHPGRVTEPFKKKTPQTIFVCSMADLFGYWVPEPQQNEIFTISCNCNRHTYIFLTKNPHRMMQRVRSAFYGFGEKFYPSQVPANLWFGTTITNQNDFDERIGYLKAVPTENRFISFEPLLGKLSEINLEGVKQIIIGAQTKPTVAPDFDSVIMIQKEADRVGAKVFCKDSLSYLNIGELNNFFRRDLSWGVHK